MECATVSCDPDEICTILSTTHRTARKEHKCTECRQPIAKGSKYLVERTVYDGKLSTWKTCEDCESIRDNFFSEGWYWGDVIEFLEEHVRNCGGDISESLIAELTTGAREMVCRMIEGCWDDEEEDE